MPFNQTVSGTYYPFDCEALHRGQKMRVVILLFQAAASASSSSSRFSLYQNEQRVEVVCVYVCVSTTWNGFSNRLWGRREVYR
jgi:hypothetical protein